ncbi:MAG: IS21-like element helper ATPase IstB [Bacteroidetes bacterium]|nr:IS21-like element helper ATPase IstB [Bacteroidota bacterium]MDA1119635.1 IS21-like element helper ATPase IstB [Bacteroidota bacterium]
MNNLKQQITDHCRQFKTTGISNQLDALIQEAESGGTGFMEYTLRLLQAKAEHRHHNEVQRRLKTARLPHNSKFDHYDYSFENGIHKNRINQLRELNWLDQGYNIMLMGPSGTGKTYIAAGLCSDAVQKGYKAYFRTMEELVNMFKMKDVTRTALAEYKRLSKANLIVIDDIMLFPIEKNQAVNLFNFINQLYENTSFIITTNKKPTEWAKMLDDEVLATALLDRLLYRCDIMNLAGKSYRMENRKTFFEQEK